LRINYKLKFISDLKSYNIKDSKPKKKDDDYTDFVAPVGCIALLQSRHLASSIAPPQSPKQ
jgi:hypothetical protein